jgi:hypothetical protein
MSTRRDFLKLMAAAMATPVLGFTPRTSQPIDLQQWCDDSVIRYDLSAPFVRAGHVYATDGRVCVRLPSEEDATTGDRRVPAAEQLPAWLLGSGWRDWPAQDWRPDPSAYECCCPICKGCGRVGADVGTCKTCEGDGEAVYEGANGAYMATCRACRGLGYGGGKRCGYCEGDGIGEGRPKLQKVGGIWLAGWMDRQIRSLPNVRYVVIDAVCLRFAFDGGEGLAMGLSNKARQEPNHA